MYKRQLEKYPDWYYQKKAHKGNLWYKQLPSQTAQETCKQLDKAWRSFYVLKKTGGIKDPNPPHFKQGNIPVTYMQMGLRHEKGSDQLRLSLPKDLKRSFQNAFKDYFTGNVEEDAAKANFETAIKEKYPELTDVVWPA